LRRPLKVLQFGLGPIGLAAARLVLEKPSLELAGAVDIDPAKVGKDLGVLLGIGPIGKKVYASLHDLPARSRPDAALHCTVSWLEEAVPQLIELASRGIAVVSSTEELLYPWWKYRNLAARLDRKAKRMGIAILGTGVNPGFVLDTVPLVLSGACTRVDRIRLERVVDAGTRRMPLQRKIGAGLSVEEWTRRARAGRMGHAGFVESVALVAKGLGWELSSITERLHPAIAEQAHRTEYLRVEPGQVTGIHQTCTGRFKRREVIHADLQMYVGAENPHDRIVIEGSPRLDIRFEGGVAGDAATAAMLVNMVPLVAKAEPGLKSILDLPMPRFLGGSAA
jgi:4-hydroxy-tetrahydrodipicolinate reductase